MFPKHSMAPSPRQRRLIFSYAPDWILTIVLAMAFLSLDKVDGYRRLFSLDDPSLRYPYAEHVRVPNVPLYLICILAPFCIMAFLNVLTIRSWWDFHNSTLGLVLASALTGTVTQVVKITVGRPRPDLIDRCQPPAGLTDPLYGLTSWTVCTQTDRNILRDGFRSFFSGHSSSSFAGLGFLSFYMAGKLHLFDSRGYTGKGWLSLSPFMAASLVAISRTMDYRHHWHDVLVGALVGTLFAFFAYHQYYPSLSSPLSHMPYAPRIKHDDTHCILPIHNVKANANANTNANANASASASASAVANVNGNAYPFVGQGLSAQGGSTDTRPYQATSTGDLLHPNEDHDLAGTVPRPGPQSLEEVWREGSEDLRHDRDMATAVVKPSV